MTPGWSCRLLVRAGLPGRDGGGDGKKLDVIVERLDGIRGIGLCPPAAVSDCMLDTRGRGEPEPPE